MDKVCFLKNKEMKFDCNIIKVSNEVISITFIDAIPDDDIVVSGFYIENEYNATDMTGDYYYEYNTIYRKYDDNIQKIELSNDGSIYVEPEVVIDNTIIDVVDSETEMDKTEISETIE